jgi:hypothetical protein
MARPREHPRAPAAGFPMQPQPRSACDACFSISSTVQVIPVLVCVVFITAVPCVCTSILFDLFYGTIDYIRCASFSMAGKDKEDEEGRGEGEEEEEGAKRDEEELGLDDGTISGQVMRVACQRACSSA